MFGEATAPSSPEPLVPAIPTAQQYSYPNGHLGHLSAQEDQALREFKKLLTQKGFYKKENGETQYSKCPDGTLL